MAKDRLGILLPLLGGAMSFAGYGYTPRRVEDTPTNQAQFFTTFKSAGGGGGGGCSGFVAQTVTSTGTVTINCTGTLTMDVIGPGGKAANASYYSGSGGGAFASSVISVTNGQTWLANVPGAVSSNQFTTPAFICPTANTNCATGTITNCVGTFSGLSSSNLVCASNGQEAHINSTTGGLGGTTATSLGVTLFKGGNGGSGSSIQPAGGGGSAGSAGAGNNGTSTVGGSGDAGSGGAGGVYNAGTNGGAGGANVNGGGGGGGGAPGYIGGAGGAPGGGSGGSNGTGGRGQVIIHSDASDVLTPVLTGGSGHGGGTISMTLGAA